MTLPNTARTFHIKLFTLVAALFVLLALAAAPDRSAAGDGLAPEQNEPPVIFADIPHVPLGDAELRLVPDGLIISNIGDTGEDGVASLISHAFEWRAGLELAGEENALWQATALGNIIGDPSAFVVSLILVQANASEETFDVTADFASTHYRVEYWNGQSHQKTVTGFSTDNPDPIAFEWEWLNCLLGSGPTFLCDLQAEFRQRPDGLCEWVLIAPEPFVVPGTENNPQFADRIAFVEDGGHSPTKSPLDEPAARDMTFDEIRLTGANLQQMAITEETVSLRTFNHLPVIRKAAP